MPATDILARKEELAAKAVALRAERKFNCAQAVACALADEVGADFETCYRLSEGFGGGMGTHTETCGAISGAVIALSQLNSGGTEVSGTTKTATYQLVRTVVEGFQEMNGTTICRELKGVDNPEGMRRSCPGCIEDAVNLAVEVIAARAQQDEN